MAILIDIDGTETEVKPDDGKSFHLEQLYKLLECDMVELQMLGEGVHPAGPQMIMDEEGKLTGKETNEKATKLWAKTHDLTVGQLMAHGDHIVGKVLICSRGEFR